MNSNTHPTHKNGIGLYLHIPFCEQKCRFCNFYIAPGSHPLTSPMVSALIREMELACKDQKIKTVYIGGGTPSHLPQPELLRLIKAITAKLTAPVEFTIEANPDQLNQQRLEQLFAAGVNRLSIGAQSFDDQELAWMSRTYTAQQIRHAVKLAQQSGFTNISLDLIYNVPGSDLQKWSQSLQAAIDLDLPHISAYSLTYEPGTQLFRDVEQGHIKPLTNQQDRDMYELTLHKLNQAGIQQYEVSNFARPGFACQHNQRYWNNLDTIGIGPSAASFQNGLRTTNRPGIRPYIQAVENATPLAPPAQRLPPHQQARETAILMLRQTQGVNRHDFKRRYHIDPLEFFAKPLKTHQPLGLIEINQNYFRLTPKGMAVADAILCDFIE